MKENRLMFKTNKGEEVYVEVYNHWEENLFLKDEKGRIFILNSQKEVSDYSYDRVDVVGNYILAYFGAEKHFHIYDKDGKIQKYNNNIIEGHSYESKKGCLQVNKTDEMTYLFFDNKIECLKKVDFVTDSAGLLVGIMKLSHYGVLFFSFVSKSHGYVSEIKLHTKAKNYSLEATVKNKEVCLTVTINDTEVYAVGFAIIQNITNTVYIATVEVGIMQLNHPICKWMDSRYVLCEGEGKTKVLYDLAQKTTIPSIKEADGVEICIGEKEIWFYQMSQEAKYYTEIYDQETGVLLKVLEPMLRNMKNIDIYVTVKLENTHTYETSNCKLWIGESGCDWIQSKNCAKRFPHKLLKVQALDGYLFVAEQTPEQEKREKAENYVFKIFEGMEEMELVLQKEKQAEDSIGVTGAWGDFIALYGKHHDVSECCIDIYYKGIKLAKTTWNAAPAILEEIQKQGGVFRTLEGASLEKGFIDVPVLGEYFVDYHKNKAYSKKHVMYWIRKYIF